MQPTMAAHFQAGNSKNQAVPSATTMAHRCTSTGSWFRKRSTSPSQAYLKAFRREVMRAVIKGIVFCGRLLAETNGFFPLRFFLPERGHPQCCNGGFHAFVPVFSAGAVQGLLVGIRRKHAENEGAAG